MNDSGHSSGEHRGVRMLLATVESLKKLRTTWNNHLISSEDFYARKHQLLAGIDRETFRQIPEEYLAELAPLVKDGTLDAEDVALLRTLRKSPVPASSQIAEIPRNLQPAVSPKTPPQKPVIVTLVFGGTGVLVLGAHLALFDGLGLLPLLLMLGAVVTGGLVLASRPKFSGLSNRDAWGVLRGNMDYFVFLGAVLIAGEAFALWVTIPEMRIRNVIDAVVASDDPCALPSIEALPHATQTQRLALKIRKDQCEERSHKEEERERMLDTAECAALPEAIKKGVLTERQTQLLSEASIVGSDLVSRRFTPDDLRNFDRYTNVCSSKGDSANVAQAIAGLLAESPNAWEPVVALNQLSQSVQGLLNTKEMLLPDPLRESIVTRIEASAAAGLAPNAERDLVEKAEASCALARLLGDVRQACAYLIAKKDAEAAREEARRKAEEARQEAVRKAEEARQEIQRKTEQAREEVGRKAAEAKEESEQALYDACIESCYRGIPSDHETDLIIACAGECGDDEECNIACRLRNGGTSHDKCALRCATKYPPSE